jgi:lipase maturation factor 1
MFTPENYTIAALWLPRLLGLIFLAAFVPFLFQVLGLFGKEGILPIETYLRVLKERLPRRCYYQIPTLFWFNTSNAALLGLVVLGTLLSVLLVAGVWPSLMLFLLYFLYLSIVSAGQDFLSFGWEGFFLEITANTFFLSLESPPNLMVWISLNLLLGRFFFQGGIVKLQSRDPNWHNLTAIAYHYQSQPLPNAIAWYVHKLPLWFHKLSAELMFFVELFVPFLIFGPETVRLAACAALFSLLFSIWLTGNFSYLNHLSAVLCIILVGNRYLSPWLSAPPPAGGELIDLLCTSAGAALLLLQLMQLWNHFRHNPYLEHYLQKVAPFHLANRYGIFAIMTTKRYEIIFEGSQDGVEWKEYLFRYKPSEVNRRPRRISPYQPRIDWQAWFLPLGGYRFDPWYERFLYHLLKGTPAVMALLRENPFPEHPPRLVRALMYEYEFSSWQEKKATGAWWRRKYAGIFTQTVTLKEE